MENATTVVCNSYHFLGRSYHWSGVLVMMTIIIIIIII